MSKWPEYVILESDTHKSLESDVRMMLHGGEWRLVGGVSVVAHSSPNSPSPLRFYQAMTKGGKSA